MNLGETRVPKECAPAMGAPYSGTVRSLCISREVEDIGITSRCEHNHVGSMAIQLARHQVARYNAARSAID